MPDTKLLYSFTTTPNPIPVSIGGDNPAQSFVDLLVMIDNPGGPVPNVKKITIEIPVGGGEGASATPSSTSVPSTSASGPSSSTSAPAPVTPVPASPIPSTFPGGPGYINPLNPSYDPDSPLSDYSETLAVNVLVETGEGSSTPSPSTSTPAPPTAGNRLSDSGLDAATLVLYDTNSPWDILVSGSTITITPKQAPGTVVSTIMFKLQKIVVNETTGNVPISITEEIPIAPRQPVQLPPLTKVDNNYPVKDFYAEQNGVRLNPPVLYDLDQTVTLQWVCSSQGESMAYRLRQVDDGMTIWTSDNLNESDGSAGVESPALTKSSEFDLDVLDPEGKTTETLTLTVHVIMPLVLKFFIKKYLSGRVCSLNWVTSNANRCAVEINGTRIEDNAPTDTWEEGYLVRIPDGPGTYTPSVLAYGLPESHPDSKNFDDVNIEPLVTIPSGQTLQSLAITPDGKYGVGTKLVDSSATMIEITSGDLTTLPANGQQVAITPKRTDTGIVIPNQWLALIVRQLAGNMFDPSTDQSDVMVVDIPAGTGHANTIPVVSPTTAIATTLDGKFALVTSYYNGSVSVINLETLTVDTTIDTGAELVNAVAVTPDGKFALVTGKAKVAVINLTTWGVDTIPTDPADGVPSAIAITGDGIALVATGQHRTVRVIDIANRRVESQVISTGYSPNSIAVTADGKLAMVTNAGDGTLTVFKIADPSATPITIPIGGMNGAGSIVTSEQANIALVATDQATLIQLTLMQD